MKSVRGDENGGSERLFRGGSFLHNPSSSITRFCSGGRFEISGAFLPGGNNYDTQSSQKLSPRVKFKTCVQNGSGSAQNAANR